MALTKLGQIHIVYFCSEYPPVRPGGIGIYTQTIARELVQQGHKVTVIGLYLIAEKKIESDNGVTVIRLPNARHKGTGFLINGRILNIALTEIHQQHAIDVIEGAESSFALLPRRYPIPRIIRMHGGHHYYTVTLGASPRPWRSFLEMRSFARADALVSASKVLADTTSKLLKLDHRLIEVIPNPVNVQHFSPRSEIAEEPGMLLYLGTITEKKGIQHLVNAMPRIIEAVPDSTLHILGRDSIDRVSGLSTTETIRSSIPAGISERIHFEGAVHHSVIPDRMARAQVVVLPSHMEAFGIVFIEGMAMGKPVVVGYSGAGSEIVTDNVTGLLCDPLDPNSIADAVIRLLQNDELRSRLGQAARKVAVERYAVENVVDKNLKFYQRVISEFDMKLGNRA